MHYKFNKFHFRTTQHTTVVCYSLSPLCDA